MHANKLEQNARPRGCDDHPDRCMPKGIPHLLPVCGDAKTGRPSHEYGEIASARNRRRQKTAKSQDMLSEEECFAARITPACAALKDPGTGAHVR